MPVLRWLAGWLGLLLPPALATAGLRLLYELRPVTSLFLFGVLLLLWAEAGRALNRD